MTLVICLSFASTTLASGPPAVKEAAITKLLQVPVGTEFPVMGFIFRITPAAYNGSTVAADLLNLPIVGNTVTGTRTGQVTINMDRTTANLDSTINNVETYYQESVSLFANINFPNAGVYEYDIVEFDTTYIINSNLHEALALSTAQYRIGVWVVENANGVPVIESIGATRIVKEDGTPGSDKVNPTPGGDQVTTNYSQMTFTNRYVRTNGAPNPDNPNPQKPGVDGQDPIAPGHSTLNIVKAVTGNMGSQILPFRFALTINVPNLIPSYMLDFYKAYLVDATGVLDPTGTVNAASIGTDTSANAYKYIKFESGTALNFQLKHGQSLVFINTPVGTSYNVTETAEPGYTATVTVFTNSARKTPVNTLMVSDLVGERFNAASYVNAFGDPTPGGLNINDLPFYGLILLAVGGLVLFIVFKSRKRNKG